MVRVRPAVRALVGLGLGIAALAIASRVLGVGVAEVARDVAGVPAWAIALCAVSAYLVFAAQSLRWWAVMRPMLGLRYGQAYRAQVVGAMFNVVGLRAGDLLRVEYLARRTGKSRAVIFGTEVVDRWLDFWGWIPVAGALAAFGAVPRWILATMALFGGVLAAWAVAMVLLTRWGRRPKPGSRLAPVVASFRGGVGAFRARRTWGIALFIAPLPWLWEAVAIFVTARAFGIALSPAAAFCVLVVFNLAMFVPSPGGVGAVEAGGTAALVLFGADHGRALAYMLVYHLAQLLPSILTGIAILVAEDEHLLGSGAPPLGERSKQANERRTTRDDLL
jgi:uncharacterized protein (TIRG00374 family)